MIKDVSLIDEPWEIPTDVRRGCSLWIPAKRWKRPKAFPRRSAVDKPNRAWPKTFPRRSRQQTTPFLPEPVELLKRRRRPRNQKQKLLSHRNAPTTPWVDGDAQMRVQRGHVFSPAVRRLQAGRDASRLAHLANMSLFHRRCQFEAKASVQPGRCAKWKGGLVYIVSRFPRRGVWQADVLPLEPVADSACWTGLRKTVTTCPEHELHEVGCKMLELLRKNLKKGRLYFRETDDVQTPTFSTLWDTRLLLNFSTPQPHTDETEVRMPSTGHVTEVVPVKAQQHAASPIHGQWHRVVVPRRFQLLHLFGAVKTSQGFPFSEYISYQFSHTRSRKDVF